MRRRSERLFAISFLAPAVLIYGVFVIWPLIQSFQFSLYDWSGLSMNAHFIGLKNFKDLFQDEAFHKALQNNLELLVVGGFCTLLLAILIAHALQGKGTGPKLLRSVVLVPQMLSLAVVAILWQFIFNPNIGLVTSGMNALHLDKYVHTWLGESKTALGSVGVAFVWWACGFYVMLFSAALRGIPEEVKEAAELDGAIGLQRFRKVTWPMLWSIKRVSVVHLTISVMNVFVLVYLMTNGGPDRASEMLLTYLYETAIRDVKFGYGTSLAVVNFAVVMALCGLILFIYRRGPEKSR